MPKHVSFSKEETPLQHRLSAGVSFAFLAGSICFLSSGWAYKVGDYLFILGSITNCSIALWGIRQVSLEIIDKEESEGVSADYERDEWQEIFHYLVANFVFAAGCILFLPGIYPSQHVEDRAQEVGAWLFILGSLGFVFASYWNALSLADKHRSVDAPRIINLITHVELFLSLFGSVLFVVASFMYRPSLKTNCAAGIVSTEQASAVIMPYFSRRLRGRPHLGNVQLFEAQDKLRSALCENIVTEGTWCYIVGSSLFLLQTSLCLARVKEVFGPERKLLMRSTRSSPARSSI